jgi:hypothetical protein
MAELKAKRSVADMGV